MFDLRVDGGLVARLDRPPVQQSIGIKDGRIAALGEIADIPARETIDAGGALLLPGLIDPHVHLGFTDRDMEWGTETRAAAIGGITTPLVYFRDPGDYSKTLPDFLQHGATHSHVDFAVHLGILNDGHLRNFDALVDTYGIRSIKMYTTYKDGSLAAYGVVGQDDGFILDVMRAAAARGDVLVNVHCENDDIVKRGASHWASDSSADNPLAVWSLMRPPLAEVEAIQRICLFARETGARLYLPHVSSAAALHTAVEQRGKGTQVHIETCPQYLLSGLTAAAEALAKVNPPVRIDEEGTELWKAVRNGDVDTVGTDHACWCQINKKAASIRDVSPGFPGLGTLLPLMMDSIAAERMTVGDLVRLNSRAADLFDLPEHGRIAPGYAADLVVVDPAMRKEVDATTIRGGSDFSPWQGRTLQGWPVLTIQRGTVIARDGELTGDPVGRYLRTTYHQARWAAA